MVKAHSLLYAIYICLLISIICSGLIYFSNLYNQLNLHYNLREEMYIHNQSIINYALGNKLTHADLEDKEIEGIQGTYKIKNHGLLNLLEAISFIKKDTVRTIHFVGEATKSSTALHLANFSKGISYSGKVDVVGDIFMPTNTIETSYVLNEVSRFSHKGKKSISEIQLPKINSAFEKIYQGINSEKSSLNGIEKHKDSIYFNSFKNPTKEINVSSILSNSIFKGNFILRNEKSIRIKKDMILEDVIIMAPEVIIEKGFSGNIQVFSIKKIEVEENVALNYPSVICLYNNSFEQASIKINKNCKIQGAVVLFGNPMEKISANTIEIDEKGSLLGDIYCSGQLDLKSNVYGSVYTNRFSLKTPSATYDNIISNIEIDFTKKPDYFISIPLFEAKKTNYGIIKKVL